MSSGRNFTKFKTSCEALATVPRKKYETLKYKYKCLKRLFKIYDTNVQLTYAQGTHLSGEKCLCESRNVYVQTNLEELVDCLTPRSPSKNTFLEVSKYPEVTESDYRSDHEAMKAEKSATDPVCVNYVQEYRSTPFDTKPTSEPYCERPIYKTRKTIGLVKFFSKICGGDARSCTNDGTSNRRSTCKRKRRKRRRKKHSLITLF